jgi:hypothetical protein
MATPHVSGAIAAFLSIRREFIGKPLEDHGDVTGPQVAYAILNAVLSV